MHYFQLPHYTSIERMVSALRPTHPVHCMHPKNLKHAAVDFIDNFPGITYYAIKSNSDPYVLKHLYDAGIHHFDVASIREIQQVYDMFPKTKLAFMNPVKSAEAIHSAYFDYNVRDFVTDTLEETHKIYNETNKANDLTIVVRLAMDKGSSICHLTDKFGCSENEAVSLLQLASTMTNRVGLSFHVGSQTLDPESYALAIRKAGEVIKSSGVNICVLDVGGGFPSPNLGMDILPMQKYFTTIKEELQKLNLPETCEIWAEPGRALSGTCSTLVVRVELRKGNNLYINDGSYGNMLEVATMNWTNKVKVIRDEETEAEISPFSFYGPTCDSIDYMKGPFMLPSDIKPGDWIAIESMGAYTSSTQTHFNGFYSDFQVEIS